MQPKARTPCIVHTEIPLEFQVSALDKRSRSVYTKKVRTIGHIQRKEDVFYDLNSA